MKKTPIARIRRGAILSGIIVLVAVIGYHWQGRSWIDALYMVVITLSSVGYGERSTLAGEPGEQLFTIGLIVLGMVAVGYTLSGFIQLITEGELERALHQRRMTKDIEKLYDHLIVCGYGRTGQILAVEAHRRSETFLVIDKDPERIDLAQQHGYRAILGDATEEETLTAAGVERARALVTGLPNDAVNVFLTLTARDLNPRIYIVARADDPATERKLVQAGADRVVLPAAISARRMAWLVARRASSRFLEMFADQSMIGIDLDEITVPADSKLIGVSIAQTDAHRVYKLFIVAVQPVDEDKMIFNPDAEYVFHAGDTVVLLGKMNDIEQFRGKFRI